MPRSRRTTLLVEAAAGSMDLWPEEEADRWGRSLVRAAEVCSLIWRVAVAAHELGHWPTQREYADHAGITERTAQREWVRFKRAFPGEVDPERLARYAASELGRRLDEGPAAVAELSWPARERSAA